MRKEKSDIKMKMKKFQSKESKTRELKMQIQKTHGVQNQGKKKKEEIKRIRKSVIPTPKLIPKTAHQ